MDVNDQATYITTYLDKCAEHGRTTPRLSPPMSEFLRDHPEVLENYRETRGVCGQMSDDPKRVFLCIGESDGHDECPQPTGLTELRANTRMEL